MVNGVFRGNHGSRVIRVPFEIVGITPRNFEKEPQNKSLAKTLSKCNPRMRPPQALKK